MKKTLSAMLVLCASFAATANAQEAKLVTGKVHCVGNTELVLPEGSQFMMSEDGTTTSLTPFKISKAEEDAELGALYVNVVSERRPYKAWIFNKETKKQIQFKRKEGVVKVPVGTYDMFVYFSGEPNRYVFKENIKLEGEVRVDIDENEATIPVEFHYFDENGKELHLDIMNGKEVDTKGTADGMRKVTSVVHKDYGLSDLLISIGYKRKGHLEDFYINKLSDKYFVGQSTLTYVGSHNYVYKGLVEDFSKSVVNTVPANLIKLVSDITPTPIMADHEYKGLPGVEVSYSFNGDINVSMRSFSIKNPADDGKVIVFMDCPESKSTDNAFFNVFARPLCSDYYFFDEENEDETFRHLLAPYVVGNAKEGAKYIASSCDLYIGFSMLPTGKDVYYPGHPEFSFTSADGTASFGNCAPIVSYRSYKWNDAGTVENDDQFRYLGRHNELFENDQYIADTKEEATPDGTKLTITNTNVKVDDVEGKNVTEILYDLNKEDNTAPTFQMLSFKDANGNICDHFESTKGGKMLVAGGDFTCVFNEENPNLSYFVCENPVTVNAYYAPHGTENWEKLPLHEDPSKYFMPAYGNFYEANLEYVMVNAADTWFDLRLEMTDAAGNYQKQLVAPAFKVATVTSIEQVEANAANNSLVVSGKKVSVADGNAANITVRSIDGRTMQNVYADSVDLSGMGAGIYVVTAATENGKAMSTKVAL